MDAMTSEDFKVLMDFVGFGDPNGPYWFIGLEEAGELDFEEGRKDLERYRSTIFACEPGEMKENESRTIAKGKRFTTIYYYMSYLVLASSGKASDYDACRSYRDNELLQAHSGTFQANLYPIGKTGLSTWDENCKMLTGYKKRNHYYKWVEDERFRMLHNHWLQYNPHITICFGASHWDKFEELLDIKKSEPETRDCGWYRIYRSRIILCPFFVAHKMKKNYKEQLATEIQLLLRNAKAQ
jgi:hypothetical protein